MSSLKHVGGIAAAMTLVGCVLLVDPIEVHEHCTVKTSTSCGACIARNCQVDVDACCGDRSCSDESSMLGVVNQCAVGDARLCGSGLANPSFGVEESVRSCLVSSCQAECLQGSADGGAEHRGVTDCEVLLRGTENGDHRLWPMCLHELWLTPRRMLRR